MSKRTRENKKRSFLRKAQARDRVGTYYVKYNETSQAGVEYIKPKAKRGLRLPKIININFQNILDTLLGRKPITSIEKEGGDA